MKTLAVLTALALSLSTMPIGQAQYNRRYHGSWRQKSCPAPQPEYGTGGDGAAVPTVAPTSGVQPEPETPSVQQKQPSPPAEPAKVESSPEKDNSSGNQPYSSGKPAGGSASQNGGSSGGFKCDGSDRDAWVKLHNDYRRGHAKKSAAPEITWNKDLADKAFLWTNDCVYGHTRGKFGSYGENANEGPAIASYGASSVFEAWTSESGNWKSEEITTGPRFDAANVGHFTQVVWKSTTEIGCGCTVCGGNVIGLCFYKEQGNILERFIENVDY